MYSKQHSFVSKNNIQVRRGDQRQRVVPSSNHRGRAQPLVRDNRGLQVSQRGNHLGQTEEAGIADVGE